MARLTKKLETVDATEEIMWTAALFTYVQYAILILFGHIRDFFGNLSGKSRYLAEPPRAGYAKLLVAWENFYTTRVYHRLQDVFNRPVQSAPGAVIDVCKRTSNDGNKTLTVEPGQLNRCINLGSYNYLGFGDDWMSTCSESVFETVKSYPLACSSPPMEYGTTPLHTQLEKRVADFVGKPDAMIFSMGYLTNATVLPALMGKGSLLISDALNHASIVNGARASPAPVRVFRHNSASHLEDILRDAIAYGQPRTHRPWKKIMVVVEGIYSMEGEICALKEIVQVCKKYKAYIYVDEAHSIGALGKTGRGICEYCGVDPADIDILMGTFTKSFGAMGGYIAASNEVISHLRNATGGARYSYSMSPVITRQVLTAFDIITGDDGTNLGKNKLNALRENSNYFRSRLKEMGVKSVGDEDSPVIPVFLYQPGKIAAFARECLKRNLAVVVVGFPATPLLLGRVRFCLSAAHTKEQLKKALDDIEEVVKLCKIRYETHLFG